jgi:hypothetical protein
MWVHLSTIFPCSYFHIECDLAAVLSEASDIYASVLLTALIAIVLLRSLVVGLGTGLTFCVSVFAWLPKAFKLFLSLGYAVAET